MTAIRSTVQTLSKVLQSGCFSVPWHQRYYDWRVEQVEELLDDIAGAVDADMHYYFIGSIMLVDSDSPGDQVINDGQQRLITLSLLVAALCRKFDTLDDHNNVTLALRALFDRPDDQASYMADVDSYQPRIQPSKTDRTAYKHILRGYSIGTNGRLAAAYDAVEHFVVTMATTKLNSFFGYVMQRLQMAVLTIPTNVDANSFFEALNARGKSLDDVDLLRNRFYSYFSDTDDARHETIHECLERASVITGKKAEAYYRCYLQCQYGHLRKNRLYRDTRLRIEASGSNVADHVYDLVRGLGSGGNPMLFQKIASRAADPDFREHFPMVPAGWGRWMHDLRRYTVSHPVLFALLLRVVEETDPQRMQQTKRRVHTSLGNVESFVLRTAFVSPKFEPSRLDAPFAEMASRIHAGRGLETLDVMDYLESKDDLGIVDDSSFVRQLQAVEMRDNRRALPLLFGINAKEQDLSAVRRSGCTVEHVLPKSKVHWDSWTGFPPGQARDYVYRIGNMVLLPKSENRADAEFNQSYDEKRRVFQGSSLEMARALGGLEGEWTPAVIEERSKKLATQAAKAWKFARTRRSRYR